jgi:hypothetical protein
MNAMQRLERVLEGERLASSWVEGLFEEVTLSW